MKRLFFTLLSATALSLLACSESSHTNNSDINSGDGEYADSSFYSSSGTSNRADINYNGDIVLDDTTNIYIQRPVIDSTGKAECPEGALCLDTLAKEVNLFLGNLKKGDRVSIWTATSGMVNDTMRVMSELGQIMLPMLPRCVSDNCTFENFVIAGDGADLSKNQFVIFEDGYYYINLRLTFDDKSHWRLFTHVDNSYFKYTGDSSKINISLSENLRGIVKIGNSPDSIKVKFAAAIGHSVTIKAEGDWINKLDLLQEGKSIVSEKDTLDNTMLTDDSTHWELVLLPLKISNYQTGPYASFTIQSSNRKLSQGEYFALPDSLSEAGVFLKKSRQKIDAFELRQDQYVWMGNFKKGDTLAVEHLFKGYGKRSVKPFTVIDYTILGKGGTPLKTLTEANMGYKVEADGPIYLHFQMVNSQNTPDAQSLELYTLLKRPGALTKFNFYDATNKKALDTLKLAEDQSLDLDKIAFESAPTATKNGAVNWFIPCGDWMVLGNVNYDSCEGNTNGELKVESTENVGDSKILIISGGSGNKAKLIAESLLDPQKRDTLHIVVK
ncbi:MAG: hypothetical protein IJ896_06950 [Fibrobacter sp.]|nr:hypothetical protein [Fibrobacter sp.]